jgi:hypothetical protein
MYLTSISVGKADLQYEIQLKRARVRVSHLRSGKEEVGMRKQSGLEGGVESPLPPLHDAAIAREGGTEGRADLSVEGMHPAHRCEASCGGNEIKKGRWTRRDGD